MRHDSGTARMLVQLRRTVSDDQLRAVLDVLREPSHRMTARSKAALRHHINKMGEAERAKRPRDKYGIRIDTHEKHRVRYQAMIDHLRHALEDATP